jgi:hypothetical protein
MIKAIEAQKAALEQRNKITDQKKIDTGFLNELANELNASKAELRSDRH